MALAQGDEVYLNVDGGLLSDPPLFGVISTIAGVGDPIVVNWRNSGTQGFASADEATNKLVKVATDPGAADLVGRKKRFTLGVVLDGHVLRSFLVGAVQTALLRVDKTPGGGPPLWAIVAASSLS